MIESLDAAVRATLVLVGSLTVVAGAEFVTSRRVFADSSLLSWKVSRFTAKWRLDAPVGRLLDRLFAWPSFVVVLALRVAVGAGLIVAAALDRPGWPLLAVVAITTVAVSVRSPFGLDGAHQMAIVVSVALSLGLAVADAGAGDRAVELAAWFITAQLVLSYLIAGIAKLAGPGWRSGAALSELLSTRMYGNPRLARALSARPRVRRLFAHAVIVFELGMPLMLVVPDPIVVGLLVVGVLFHGTTALVMGLNNFLLAFLAPYPLAAFVALG